MNDHTPETLRDVYLEIQTYSQMGTRGLHLNEYIVPLIVIGASTLLAPYTNGIQLIVIITTLVNFGYNFWKYLDNNRLDNLRTSGDGIRHLMYDISKATRLNKSNGLLKFMLLKAVYCAALFILFYFNNMKPTAYLILITEIITLFLEVEYYQNLKASICRLCNNSNRYQGLHALLENIKEYSEYK